MVRMRLVTVAERQDGCFSVMTWDGRPFGVSVERTFDPGEAAHGKRIVLKNGIYRCKRSHYYAGGYPTFEIEVDGHTRVLFHKGNREVHTEACVVTGESFGGYNPETRQYSAKAGPGDETAVLSSGIAFDELMWHAQGLEEFDMAVTGRSI